MKEYYYIIVHGIGDQAPGYSENLRKYLEVDKEFWGEICWQECVRSLEELGYEKATSDKLCFPFVREFAFKYYGDVVAYDLNHKAVYDCIHYRLDIELKKAQKLNKKIVLISHSLGTIISCGWLWDRLEETSPLYHPQSEIYGSIGDYLRKNIEFFFTLGSPLAIFGLKYPNFGKPPKFKEKTKWINIVGINDVISYPVSDLNIHYKFRKILDIYTRVGTKWWRKLLPIGHIDYFEDKNVRRIIHSIIRNCYHV